MAAQTALPYLTDNPRTLTLFNIPDAADSADDEPFKITDAFAARAAETLRHRPFLALFHPQWFW